MSIELIRKYDMLPPGARVLCAVSGGADSVCMLHLLFSLREKLGIGLAAAHYEHGLRGEESRRDARFVQELCEGMGIECRVEHGDAAGYARENGLGIEEAARELRYAFLERTADALGCTRIATAHNADDNAETVLFDLCRGSGLTGLCGIPPVRGRIVRPMLDVTRREIEEYLAANGLSHVEDSSNASDDTSRNLLRHRVMPVMRELNPAFSETVFRNSELLREDAAYLDREAETFIKKYYDGVSLPQRELAALKPAVASRVIRSLAPRSLSRQNTDDALKLCEGSTAMRFDLPGLRLCRERGRIYFGENEHIEIERRELRIGEPLAVPEAGMVLYADFPETAEEINGLFKTYLFKYDSIYGRMFVTPRAEGDRLRPVGRGCTKTLKALFAEADYTLAERERTPVLRDEKGILCLCGLAADERTRAHRGDRVLLLRIKKV